MITIAHVYTTREYLVASSIHEMAKRYSFLEGLFTNCLDTMQAELDKPTCIRLMAGCGRGCFLRHAYKQELAVLGKGSLESLPAALRNNFEVWQAKNGVNIRYARPPPIVTARRCRSALQCLVIFTGTAPALCAASLNYLVWSERLSSLLNNSKAYPAPGPGMKSRQLSLLRPAAWTAFSEENTTAAARAVRPHRITKLKTKKSGLDLLSNWKKKT